MSSVLSFTALIFHRAVLGDTTLNFCQVYVEIIPNPFEYNFKI